MNRPLYAKRLTAFSLTLGLALSGTLTAPSLGQIQPSPARFRESGLQRVREALDVAVERKQIAGAVALVTQRGTPVLFEAVGLRDAEAGRPMTRDTLFRIASMTKAVTSVAALMLVDEGMVRLDDRISRFIPEFRNLRVLKDPNAPPLIGNGAPATVPAEREPTVRDLLTHTSGFVYGFSAPAGLRALLERAGVSDGLAQTPGSLAENVQRLALVPLAHQPGKSWTYGLSTDVLGRVVETASDLDLDLFFRRRIFEPLKMSDTAFYPADDRVERLAALYRPGPDKTIVRVGDDPQQVGSLRYSATVPYREPRSYFSGGAGLVSTASDYARFLQMLLNGGELDGVRLLRAETVREMTRDQIAPLHCAFREHGDGFGFGVGVVTAAGAGDVPLPVGSYSWGGIYSTVFWVDPEHELIGILMTQLYPFGHLTLRTEFPKRVYEALSKPAEAPVARPTLGSEPPVDDRGRLVKQFWYEPGMSHGNPTPTSRFRVNAPEVTHHSEFSRRAEARSSGMLQIEMPRLPATLAGAELSLELWGGHPGTSGKRVTVNGRSTYPIAEVGTASSHCTHQYPLIRLKTSDLVDGYNAFQFACDQGTSTWGHFIVDNACLRAELPSDDPERRDAGLGDFRAKVSVQEAAGDPERLDLTLVAASTQGPAIASVDFIGFYDGFDENGDGQSRDWHGMTKSRQPSGHLGTASASPFTIRWSLAMLPAQQGMAVRAVVHFKQQPDLVYITPPTAGLRTPARRSADVRRVSARDQPIPFWSRAGQLQSASFELDAAPERIERAELRLVMWDGGAGTVASPWRLNGQPLSIHSRGRHDVVHVCLPIDPGQLVVGTNRLELRSDTQHHGIEVLRPGPELWIRLRGKGEPASDPGPKSEPPRLGQYASEHAGSPARGAILFHAKGRLSCLNCHKVLGNGGDVGPDLSAVGNKLERAHLIESILDPSRQIVEGYRATTIRTRDGRILNGIVRSETANEVSLATADGQALRVLSAEIDERRVSNASLMPENLAADLTPREFSDLIAYLESLRPAQRPAQSPRESTQRTLTLPNGFAASQVAEHLTGATAIGVLPDGRILVCEQTGALRVVKDGRLLTESMIRLTVDPTWERGLIGVAPDPRFTENGYLYLCYVAPKPYPHTKVSRFTISGDQAVPGSELVLLEGDDQTLKGGPVPAGHQGGAIHFGADGKLYVALGDQTGGRPAQDLHSLCGKLLRLNSDGSIPGDNPFFGQTSGKYRTIWATGLRNPFTFAVQSETGRIFVNDVGGAAEEINEAASGANYGWPTTEHGPTTTPSVTGPIHWYPTSSITGGSFCPGMAVPKGFPAEFRGQYFFMDFVKGWVQVLDPADLRRPATARPFATGLARPVDLTFAPNGSLYILLRNAWVHDNHFRPNTGSVLQIQYRPELITRN